MLTKKNMLQPHEYYFSKEENIFMSMCFLLDELFFISSIFIDHLFSQGDIMSDRCKLLSTKMDNPINLGFVD